LEQPFGFDVLAELRFGGVLLSLVVPFERGALLLLASIFFILVFTLHFHKHAVKLFHFLDPLLVLI
jgi:hypothetical protein